MPVCPNCNYEYVEGIKVCPDCGTELVDKLIEYNEDDWEVVFTSNQSYEVDMLKDNLDGAGIASTILDQKDRNFPAPGDLSIVKLLVKKEDVSAAKEFIDKYKSDAGKGDEEQ